MTRLLSLDWKHEQKHEHVRGGIFGVAGAGVVTGEADVTVADQWGEVTVRVEAAGAVVVGGQLDTKAVVDRAIAALQLARGAMR